jgi:ArsR family transcriptional regulator
MTDLKLVSEFYKSLSDETRLRLMLLIWLERELCVCELVVAMNESQPKISRHLAQLRSHNLLEDRRQGQWVHYRIHPQLATWMKDILALTAARLDLHHEQQLLACMGDRPARIKQCC